MPRCSESARGAAWLAACALAGLAGCSGQSAPESAPASAPPLPSVWPQGMGAPLKITDSLTLAIPLKYLRSAISPDAPQRALLSVQTDRAEARFDFFWPDLGGYTLQNYRNEFEQNKIEVVYLHAGNAHEADADAPGEYPPNVFRRMIPDLDARAPRRLYGLKCYRGTVQSDRLTCYGRRSADEDILLTVKVPPFAPADTFPMMQTRYYSPRYGGVRLAWRAHVKNFPRWHDIDAQIWKFIDAWRVAQAAASQH